MQKPSKVGENVFFEDGTYTYIGKDDGVQYDYEPSTKAWFPRITEELVKAQQEIYKVDGVDESVPVEKPGIKRKREKALGKDVTSAFLRRKSQRSINNGKILLCM